MKADINESAIIAEQLHMPIAAHTGVDHGMDSREEIDQARDKASEAGLPGDQPFTDKDDIRPASSPEAPAVDADPGNDPDLPVDPLPVDEDEVPS